MFSAIVICPVLSLDLCGLQTYMVPSVFDLLLHIVLLFPAIALWCVATGDSCHNLVLKSLLVAPQDTQICCLWTWRMLEVSANPPPLFPRSLSHPIPAGMALSCLLVLFSLPSFFCS